MESLVSALLRKLMQSKVRDVFLLMVDLFTRSIKNLLKGKSYLEPYHVFVSGSLSKCLLVEPVRFPNPTLNESRLGAINLPCL